ncbi:hypothetical protein J22TS3_36840 [Paenibacillus sp. J22TS3]|nr:hypothetical protein J22TS3_36840 [Paenibacillus sp. J22TS3]
MAGPHTLILFVDGHGALNIHQQHYNFSIGTCYLLPPGTAFQIDNSAGTPLKYCQITFNAVKVGESPETYNADIINGGHELVIPHPARLIRLAEELNTHRDPLSDNEYFRQHLRFQELLGILFEHNMCTGLISASARSVESTIQYLQQHYMHKITVRGLAEMAGVPLWQYTPIFHKLTGKKPLDFLNDIRINRSKDWLRRSDEPLRKIAQRVGFEDEFYFNRRFRRTTGTTPRQYAKSMQKRPPVRDWTGHEVLVPDKPERVIFYSETFGDLLVLGVQAIGAGHRFIAESLVKDRGFTALDMGYPINCDKLAEMEPDLIIFANSDEEVYQRISKIAPTVTYNSFAPLDHRLLTLGHWLGRRQAAEHWLEAFHTRTAGMWKELASEVRTGETASVFIYEHGRRLYVMGSIGFPTILYHPLGFQPTPLIREVIESGEAYLEILKEELAQYAGDRIFLLLSDNPVSLEAAHDLVNDPLWRDLPAVKSGRVYLLNAREWNYGDALIREQALDKLPELLLHPLHHPADVIQHEESRI